MCSTYHNEILHMPRQLHCRDVCKILLCSVEYFLNQSTSNFGLTRGDSSFPFEFTYLYQSTIKIKQVYMLHNMI